MKKVLFVLALLLPAAALAQCPACQSGATALTAPTGDQAEMLRAVTAGLSDRLYIGPYRAEMLATRRHKAELMAGTTDAYKADLRSVMTPSPAKECRIAEFAVLGLEMANAFGANIPQSVITEAIALETQVCSQVPTAAPTRAYRRTRRHLFPIFHRR